MALQLTCDARKILTRQSAWDCTTRSKELICQLRIISSPVCNSNVCVMGCRAGAVFWKLHNCLQDQGRATQKVSVSAKAAQTFCSLQSAYPRAQRGAYVQVLAGCGELVFWICQFFFPFLLKLARWPRAKSSLLCTWSRCWTTYPSPSTGSSWWKLFSCSHSFPTSRWTALGASSTWIELCTWPMTCFCRSWWVQRAAVGSLCVWKLSPAPSLICGMSLIFFFSLCFPLQRQTKSLNYLLEIYLEN